MKNRLFWGGSNFVLEDYLGNNVSLSGTHSTGLQEFVDLVAANGFPGEAVASGTIVNGSCPHPFVVDAGYPLTLPPMFGTNIHITGTIIAHGFGGEGNEINSPWLIGDTLSRCTFTHSGVIDYDGIGYFAMLFKPRNPHPPAPIIFWGARSEIYASTVKFGSLILSGGTVSQAVQFDPRYGGWNNNPEGVWFDEILGEGRCQYAMYTRTPDTRTYAYSCFVQNRVGAGLLSGFTVQGYCEGEGPINPTYNCLGTNLYEFLGITADAANIHSAIALEGVMNIAHIPSISVNAGSFQWGVTFGQNSQKNIVIAPQISVNPWQNMVNNSGAATNTVIPPPSP